MLHSQKYQNSISKLSGAVCVDNLFKKQRQVHIKPPDIIALNKGKDNYITEKINFKKEVDTSKVKSSNVLLDKIQKSFHNNPSSQSEHKQSKHINTIFGPKFPKSNGNKNPFEGFVFEKVQSYSRGLG